ncbi:Hypothetical predicted protein [Octopus vulgaris]|uniref:Uncharacterized protein n=1 Tax=Octopus vulgaris TaxID=6645 RepID=A0AA36MF04_OCTVU|nr:Hypothetical predicted protein [Octopus vulgaris]
MFIFLFYCVYKKDTRDVIKESVNKRKRANPRRVVAGRRFDIVQQRDISKRNTPIRNIHIWDIHRRDN